MTQLVGHLPLQRIAGWLGPPSPAMQHAIRYGTAAAGALWLAYAANLPQSTWPLITVMMVVQPTSGGALQKGILRLCGTVASAFVAIGLYGLFAQSSLLLAASLCLVYTVAVYGMTGPQHQYAWNVFGFTTGIILGDAMGGTNQVEVLAFDRASLVSLGLLASFAAEALLWPVRPGDQLRQSLGGRAGQVGDALQQARDAILGAGSAGAETRPLPSSPLTGQLALIDQLRGELGATKEHVHSVARLSLLLDGLATSARFVATESRQRPDALPPSLREALAELLDRSVEAVREVSTAIGTGRAPGLFGEALQSSLTKFGDERIANLATLIEAQPEDQSQSKPEVGRSSAFISALAPALQSLASMLADIENVLVSLAREEGLTQSTTEPKSVAASRSFGLDPLRLERALRAGIAVAAVIAIMPLLGWSVSSMSMILAYMVAATPTRGALTSTVLGVGAAALVAWIIADLSIIYVVPHLGRMPIALLYPLVVAGTAGFVMVRFPKLAPIAPLAALIAIMSVFGGVKPPQNVQGPYDTTVILLFGIAVGVVAQRLLWPRTAAALFLDRAAGQLDLCLRILGRTPHDDIQASRRRVLGQIATSYAQQLTLLGQLHGQAHMEPVERALGDGRRTQLLADIQALFDASLRIDPAAFGEGEQAPATGEAALEPLLAALARQDEAIVESLEAASRALRGESPWEGSGLTAAQSAVEARLADLRGQRGLAAALGARGTDALIADLDARRRLATQQAALEAWLADWQKEQGKL